MIKRMVKIIFAALLVGMIGAPFQVQASPDKKPDDGKRQYLRTGYILKSSPKYSGMVGKAASLAARMRSNVDTDVYFAFPAVSGKPYVREASYYILNRNGAYSGNVTMTLGIYNLDGLSQRQISAGSVNLQSAAIQTWTNLPLDSYYINRQIGSGEFLAFHLALDGAAGGDLEISPIFEISTEPVVIKFLQFFFPLAFN
jgi:hypothetical protein